MNFPMVALNVFAIFAITGSLVCWLLALVAIHHRKMRSATCVPVLAGLVAAGWMATCTTLGWMGIVLGLVGGAIATSMFVAYVYGWARSAAFDLDEVREGSGKFAPVMLVWTGCLLYVGVVALVNQAVTGTFTPVHVAGY
jgi:uncharacterized protein (DUF697 family)